MDMRAQFLAVMRRTHPELHLGVAVPGTEEDIDRMLADAMCAGGAGGGGGGGGISHLSKASSSSSSSSSPTSRATGRSTEHFGGGELGSTGQYDFHK
jgi:hypothetical protein